MDDESGVTRDRQYGTCEWNGKIFNIVDTGGFVQHSDDIFEAAIRSQVQIAIDEAAVIVFMVDVTTPTSFTASVSSRFSSCRRSRAAARASCWMP